MIGTPTVEIVDSTNLSEHFLTCYSELINKQRVETDPEQPLWDVAEIQRQLTTHVDFFTEERYVVWSEDRSAIVGRAFVGCLTGFDTNQHLAEGFIYVHPDYRQNGIGSALMEPVRAAMQRWNRSVLTVFSDSRLADGEAVLARLNAQKGLQLMISELVLAEVDHDLLARWVARAAERAVGYSLRFIDGPYPAELREQMAAMLNLMNTAPREDMPWEDLVWSADHLRQMDEELSQSGRERRVAVAVDPVGNFCGYTAVFWWAGEPLLVQQGDTAIDPAHRNKGLGRWLKAAMLQRVLTEWPQATKVRTGNAGSNAAMLGINRQLGFHHAFTGTGWQLPLSTLEAYVGQPAA